ncbi:MAG: secondary thiamine-phosphate synthase enzyme YjbQ [Myxococcota bacterium]|nr:secondary thiamine-phosphate synthase enzyme YjbQ [Myxococcota bacterium]
MKQAQTHLNIQTRGRGLIEITDNIASWIASEEVSTGLLTVFLKHTSASLVIQENADPDVLIDLEQFLGRIVPEDPGHYRHRAEGPDDMPAHIRSAITQTALSIPIAQNSLCLGTWQGIYLCEHRFRPHTRTLVLHLTGE